MTTVSHHKLRHDLRQVEARILKLQPALGAHDERAALELVDLEAEADRLTEAINQAAAAAGQQAGWR